MDRQEAINIIDEKFQEYIKANSENEKNVIFGLYLGMVQAFRLCDIFSNSDQSELIEKLMEVVRRR